MFASAGAKRAQRARWQAGGITPYGTVPDTRTHHYFLHSCSKQMEGAVPVAVPAAATGTHAGPGAPCNADDWRLYRIADHNRRRPYT